MLSRASDRLSRAVQQAQDEAQDRYYDLQAQDRYYDLANPFHLRSCVSPPLGSRPPSGKPRPRAPECVSKMLADAMTRMYRPDASSRYIGSIYREAMPASL